MIMLRLNIIKTVSLPALLAVFATMLACTQEPVSRETAQQSAAAATAVKPYSDGTEESVVSEISFAVGKAELSPSARRTLDRLVVDARGKGAIDDVIVITWADEEYPSPDTGKLSKQQRDLVDGRNREIKRYLTRNDRTMDIETYNMAERANAFERMLSTSDARVKRSLENAGIPNTGSKVKTPAKASKSIVMVMMQKR